MLSLLFGQDLLHGAKKFKVHGVGQPIASIDGQTMPLECLADLPRPAAMLVSPVANMCTVTLREQISNRLALRFTPDHNIDTR